MQAAVIYSISCVPAYSAFDQYLVWSFLLSAIDRDLFSHFNLIPLGIVKTNFPFYVMNLRRSRRLRIRSRCGLARTGDVDVELVGDLAVAVVEDALVGALVLLLQRLHAQDDAVRQPVRPRLEAAALERQVLEALVPLHLGRRVALHGQHHEHVLLLRARELVLRLAHELRLGAAVRAQRRRGPFPVLQGTQKK